MTATPAKPGPLRSHKLGFTLAMFGYSISREIRDALAAGLDPRELAKRLRAAADRVEAEGTN
jgi:hypothetical protein